MVVVLLEVLKKPIYGCCLVDILKNLYMVVVLLAFLKSQTWLLSRWHFKKKSQGYRPTGTFKIKNLDIVVILWNFYHI